ACRTMVFAHSVLPRSLGEYSSTSGVSVSLPALVETNAMTAEYKDVWTSGDTYEPYVGRWSRLVDRQFLEWLAAPAVGFWHNPETAQRRSANRAVFSQFP